MTWVELLGLYQQTYTAQKMKFPIKDFFSKCDQIRQSTDLVTFTEEIFYGKLHFLWVLHRSFLTLLNELLSASRHLGGYFARNKYWQKLLHQKVYSTYIKIASCVCFVGSRLCHILQSYLRHTACVSSKGNFDIVLYEQKSSYKLVCYYLGTWKFRRKQYSPEFFLILEKIRQVCHC